MNHNVQLIHNINLNCTHNIVIMVVLFIGASYEMHNKLKWWYSVDYN